MNQKKLGIVVVQNKYIIGIMAVESEKELKFKNISENEKLTNFTTRNLWWLMKICQLKKLWLL